MSARLGVFAVVSLLLATAETSFAAAPVLNGGISGIELAPQSIAGAAVFIFGYEGQVNGRTRKGWGWIAVNHAELPDEVGETALITGGVGELYIGILPYEVEVHGGLLTLSSLNDPAVFDDDFEVLMSVDVCNFFGQCGEHTFAGLLSHVPLIPAINGSLTAGAP